MKTYWDLTEKERASLTEEEVRYYLDIEFMQRGVVKPVPPRLEEITPVELKKRPVFIIKHGSGAYHQLDICFPSAEMAQKFLGLSPRIIEKDWQAGNQACEKPLEEVVIATLDIASEQDVLTVKTTLRENEKRKERNDQAKRDYDKAIDVVEKETNALREDLAECNQKAYEYTQVMALWAEYGSLTKGDLTMAFAFLVKAQTAERVQAAFDWFGQPIPVHGPADMAKAGQVPLDPNVTIHVTSTLIPIEGSTAPAGTTTPVRSRLGDDGGEGTDPAF